MKVIAKKGILMKHPFWLANSFLLILLCTIVAFIFLSRPKVPGRVSFEPDQEVKVVKKDIAKIDVSKIYTNDLFDTYKQPLKPIKTPDFIKTMPQPPLPKTTTKPAAQPPKFLEPLKINLRGIIVGSDERMNVAIIEDIKEKKARNHKVGDKIEDAQLIRILKNKIILIRSNGQQETLYVSQHDAELEQVLLPESDWSPVIKKVNSNSFKVDPDLFVEKVHNLAHFIDLLNLTTVYRKGESIGCRIGSIAKQSVGEGLGLIKGDIITKINGAPATTTDNRFEIYKQVIGLELGDTITVELLRNNMPQTITYTLEKQEVLASITTSTQIQPTTPIKSKTAEEIEQEKKQILEQKYRFAPTSEELKKRQKQNMLKMSKNRLQAPQRSLRGSLVNTMSP